MLFAETEAQSLLADMLTKLLNSENSFESRRHRLMNPVPDRMALWPHFVQQGVLGAAFAEDKGGFGGSTRDIAIVMAAAGRSLVVEPLLASALCGRMMSEAISPIMSGTEIWVFAHAEGPDPYAPRTTTVDADGRLSGIKLAVRHADLAQKFLVSASIGGEAACFVVDASAKGVTLDTFRLLDGSSAATLTFDCAPAQRITSALTLDAGIALASVALAAETAGIIQALNAATFAYLRTRKQFGVPLASFQALQHRAADMFAAEEEVRTLVNRAISALDAHDPGGLALAAAAKSLADDAGRLVSHEAVQMHGGMGVSDELDVSHYMRRLAAIRAELGNADAHRARFAALGGAVLDEGAALADFRAEVRAFVEAELPQGLRRKGALGLEIDKADYVCWQKILYRKGWFAAAWPKSHGGAGWDLERQLVFLQECAINNAPMIIPYGVNMVGPVLQAFGTADQQARWLPGILSSDTWWCQGYSEPGSGSDLASLKTVAVRDGDHYIVNGTKMWTTEAHWADMMHCLVRTDREVKAQHGISFLLIDMKTPGITITPIVTIDGQHHTNQLFFDDVRVPVENLVGTEGQGWTIAKFLLSNERVAIADTGPKLRLLGHIKTMLNSMADSPARQLMAHRLADAEIQLLSLCALEQDYVKMWAGGGSKEGPQASILKIRGTEILQMLSEIALDIEGPLGAAHDPADLHLSPEVNPSPAQAASMMAHHYLYGRCWSIFGGTNEIQRNIIARSILG